MVAGEASLDARPITIYIAPGVPSPSKRNYLFTLYSLLASLRWTQNGHGPGHLLRLAGALGGLAGQESFLIAKKDYNYSYRACYRDGNTNNI